MQLSFANCDEWGHFYVMGCQLILRHRQLGRYINCPHLCCNIRRRFFVSLAFSFAHGNNCIKLQQQYVNLSLETMQSTSTAEYTHFITACNNNNNTRPDQLIGIWYVFDMKLWKVFGMQLVKLRSKTSDRKYLIKIISSKYDFDLFEH
jgi:hypothetical protein